MMMCLINNVLWFIAYRRDVLEGDEHIFELVRDMILKTVEDVVARSLPRPYNYS